MLMLAAGNPPGPDDICAKPAPPGGSKDDVGSAIVPASGLFGGPYPWGMPGAPGMPTGDCISAMVGGLDAGPLS